MKPFLILLLLFCCQFESFGQKHLLLPKQGRVVFLGNSITYAGTYTEYIEAYLRLEYPEKKLDFVNVGLPSETVSGLSEPNHANGAFPRPDLHERLDRVLDRLNPDLIIACYGMNDGIYLPFDENRFTQFRNGIEWLEQKARNAGSDIIFLTPPIYDERKGEAYANVLDLYSDWLLSKKFTSDWKVIDIHWPMKKSLDDRRAADSTFAFAADGVHPNEPGHWIMAREVLSYLTKKEIPQTSSKEAFARFEEGNEVLPLIKELQILKKDAWLTEIGHLRPGMKTGVPIPEAQARAAVINQQIDALLK